MTGFDARARLTAAAVMFLCRAVYAFNWYNIGAVLPLVRQGFGVGTADVAVVLGAFLVGAGIFQVPAGFVALRFGNRATSIVALGAMGAFSLASGFSPNWEVLAALRFATGAGAAFFFAPALGLVTAYYPPGERGPVIGWYNAGFSAGSGAGLFLGAVIGELFGWAPALAVGGLLLFAGMGIAAWLLPRTLPPPPGPTRDPAWSAGWRVLKTRGLWALALGTSGLWAGFYVAAQWYVYYANAVHASWSLALAALVPALMIVAEIAGGPIGGRDAERRSHLPRLLAVWGVAAGIGIAAIPFLPFVAIWPMFLFLGFADGVVFAVLYLIPTYIPGLRAEEVSLGLAFLNSIQIFVGFALALAFGLVVAGWGYTMAWLLAGIASVAFIPLLGWVPAGRNVARDGLLPGSAAGSPRS